MRIPFFPIALALLGTSSWANDEKDRRYYIEWSLGGVFSETAEGVPGSSVDFNPGFATGLAIGRRTSLSERLALDLELELYYHYFTADSSDVKNVDPSVNPSTINDAKALALMLNGVLNWKFTPQYSIYGGVGIGSASTEYETWDSGNFSVQDDVVGAVQGLFGFDYNLGGNFDVLLGYRYFKTEPLDIEDATSGSVDELDIAQHIFEAKFRWGL